MVSLELRKKAPHGALPAPIAGGATSERTIDISIDMMSRMFWERILADSEYWLNEKRGAFFGRLAELDQLSRDATFRTGSISSASAWCLYCLTRYFCPSSAVEVGTYIGRSTTAIALGMNDAGVRGGLIHTCDASNGISLPEVVGVEIIQHRMTSSVEMMSRLSGHEPFAFAHIDGRIESRDVALLQSLLACCAVVAIDDFEGVEKGVANYIAVRRSEFWNTHTLIYPCSSTMLQLAGVSGRSTTAVLLPKSLIRLSNQ